MEVKEKEELKSFSLINDENWASTYSDGHSARKTDRVKELVERKSEIHFQIYSIWYTY